MQRDGGDDEIVDVDVDDNNNNNTKIAEVQEESNSPPAQDLLHLTDESPWEDLDHMDDASRNLIQQMLREQQYFGYDTPASPKKSIKKAKSEGLPSHKARWTDTEDQLLRSAIENHGYGNWKAIATQVGTRTALQCKNRARHWVQSDKLDKSALPSPTNATYLAPERANTTTPPAITSTFVASETTVPFSTSSTSEAELIQTQDDLNNDGENKNNASPPKQLNQPNPKIESSQDANIPSVDPPKTQEIKTESFQFDRDHATEDEIENNPEWFKNKASKTPDRYLKIRNHILDSWYKCKPRYLTKTSARRGLRDCGDVNAIGRVHTYLESIGAINLDTVNNAPRPPRRQIQQHGETYTEEDPDVFSAADMVIGYEGPRKRKVRNEHGQWVDPRELEGRVIEHGQDIQPVKAKRVSKRPQRYVADEFGRGYDPFRLVPVEYYDTEEFPAPFTVIVNSDALLVMDFHSYLAHTEIIGLLGGRFDAKSRELTIESVFPCHSTSTGIQCEMDPASEMKAREEFASQGYDVVGWYHSHPTFEPQPSIRDIENQTSYQTLFRNESTGDEPFVGVIVSPYDIDAASDHSQIQYLHISPRWNELHLFRLPYACRRVVRQSKEIAPVVLRQFRQLIDEFKDYEHKMDMTQTFRTGTRLDKLLEALRAHIFLPVAEEEEFLSEVRQLFA
ncbi:hypothetical protein BCR43DRAFT_510398 [Syncephalastrum racemosum]|uniref:Uncharacterized protein n=1 Tax=Syncephalastrum racemosum TaxID=13706 RepID=A0A1X2HUT2_SYNRA|nr:hypothetical protein BCR43DRAFT_510398 [Syncephalastrum racemosum]